MDQPCSLKRKLELEEGADQPTDGPQVSVLKPKKCPQDLLNEAASQITILNSSLSSSQSDRLAAKRAVHALFILYYNVADVNRNSIVNCGGIPALLKHLKAPEPVREGDGVPKPHEHAVEEGCVRVLGLLAINPEHKQLIVDAGALPCLIGLLKRHKTCDNSPELIKRLASAIRDLAYQNNNIQNRVRMEGGIPPLVELLEFDDAKVQGAAAEALSGLTFQNDENQKEVVRCNALPTLVLMLGSDNYEIQLRAVETIENLVQYSPNIKREVLLAGALQPVIRLLRSWHPRINRRAAFLIGLFASVDSDCKVRIAQRGAIQPLIDMLKSPDVLVQGMSAFALAILAQDTNNQAGIASNGGIEPLLNLLCSKNGSLQRYAALILYVLADNEDNVVGIVKAGGVQKLQEGDFITQLAKDHVGETLKTLERKMHGPVLKQLLYLMRFGGKVVQSNVALAFAHLCAHDDQKYIFVDNNGLEFLLDLLLKSTNLKQKREASMALHSLAVRTTSVSPFDLVPPPPTPKVYLDEQYVNNPTFSDITFLVEDKQFYAHRICLLASSDAFRAMFDGDYREREAKDIPIPNIKWDVFELMMRFIYTGNVDVNLDIAQDLLRGADQYLLDGLKQLCERAIAQDVSVENVSLMYELSESFNALSLRQTCIQFLLEQFDQLNAKPWYSPLMCRIVPNIRKFFRGLLTKPTQAQS